MLVIVGLVVMDIKNKFKTQKIGKFSKNLGEN